MDDTNFIHHKVDGLDKLLDVLERIARAQEGMVSLAMAAHGARVELSKKLQEKLKQPFEEK